jgi:hypothetical protein
MRKKITFSSIFYHLTSVLISVHGELNEDNDEKCVKKSSVFLSEIIEVKNEILYIYNEK